MTPRSFLHVPPIYCGCGAIWIGRYALHEENPVVRDHEARPSHRCGFISAEAYIARYPHAARKVRDIEASYHRALKARKEPSHDLA